MATLTNEPPFGAGLVVDNLAQVKTSTGVWADYQVRNQYVRHEQTYMMPVTSPNGFQGNSVAFVQLAAPTEMLVVHWSAAKWAAVPTLPDPSLYQTGWVFLYSLPETVMKILAADGVTAYYRVNGVYVYGKQNPSDSVFGDVTFPNPPWLEPGPTDFRTVPPNSLDKSIIGPAGNPGGGGGGLGGGGGFGPVPAP